jgi:hypothetical protein
MTSAASPTVTMSAEGFHITTQANAANVIHAT